MQNISQLDSTYQEIINSQKKLPYFKNLEKKLQQDYADKSKTIYPKYEDIFNAFALCAFKDIKVVIIGQDPYHNANQAHGLCFSVANNTPPPSLKNILKAIKYDLGIASNYQNGDLTPLAKQGVLLLNTIFSVEENKPLSHQDYGWEIFSDYLIQQISNRLENVIFLLWGNYAQKKASLIDDKKHYILKSSHPSPLGAYRGFNTCKHFSKTNEILTRLNKQPIIW